MAEVGSAFVSLLPSMRGFGSKAEHELAPQMGGMGKRLGKGLGTALKVGAGAALAGGAALGGFLKGSLDEAREAQKVGAQSAAVIKSTGGVAKVTTKHLGNLTSAISKQTGIDDEAIQTGSNLLLTFKDIRNEAGKGNDIFDQTTSIMTDMATAMGKEPRAAAIQLGKALNDPVKGMTALAKVGVTFTEKQKAVNKALVEGGDANALMAMGLVGSTAEFNAAIKQNNGDVMKTVNILTKDLNPAQKKTYDHFTEGGHKIEAQRVILKELRSEFGGTAKAVATNGDKFKVAFGNLQETVGTALLPAIDTVLGKLTDLANALPGKFATAKDKISNALAPLKAAIAPKIKAAFEGISIKGIGANLAAQAKGWAKPVIDGFKTGLATGDWSGLGSALGNGVVQALTGLAALATNLSASFSALFAKIDWVGIGIAIGKQVPSLLIGLAAGILNFDLMGLLGGLARHWQDILLAIIAVAFTPGKIVGKVAEVLARIPLVGKMLAWALTHFKTFSDGLVKLVGRALGFLGRAFMAGFRRVFPTVGKAFGEALRILPLRLAVLALDVQAKALRMVRGIGNGIAKGIGFVAAKIGELTARIIRPFAKFGSLLFSKGGDLVRGLWNGIKASGAWLVRKLKSFVLDHIPGPIAKVLGIHSPSRVMAKQAQWIPKGMAKGIDANAHHVGNAMTRLAGSVQAGGAPGGLNAANLSPGSAAKGQQIRGTLGIDRDGVAYIHGVSRDEVHHHAAAQQASDRAAAMSL